MNSSCLGRRVPRVAAREQRHETRVGCAPPICSPILRALGSGPVSPGVSACDLPRDRWTCNKLGGASALALGQFCLADLARVARPASSSSRPSLEPNTRALPEASFANARLANECRVSNNVWAHGKATRAGCCQSGGAATGLACAPSQTRSFRVPRVRPLPNVRRARQRPSLQTAALIHDHWSREFSAAAREAPRAARERSNHAPAIKSLGKRAPTPSRRVTPAQKPRRALKLRCAVRLVFSSLGHSSSRG